MVYVKGHISVVVWMKMTPTDSYICILGSQLVELFGSGEVPSLEEVCHWVSFEVSKDPHHSQCVLALPPTCGSKFKLSASFSLS